MGFARLYSRALLGMDSPQVTIEVHTSNGLPNLTIVGLPEASVKESRERVRSALQNAGFEMPLQRITVNLAPADLPKSGGRFDLAIALGILAASGQIALPHENDFLAQFEFYSELSLSGECRGIQGALPSLIAAQKSQRQAILSVENAQEIRLLQQDSEQFNRPVFVAKALGDAIDILVSEQPQPFQVNSETFDKSDIGPCLSEIRGQIQAKRVLEICASGGHSLLMVGEPGAGKTMLASRLPGILPKMSANQAIETAAIHSIAGQSRDLQHFYQRPFLQPHHTASTAALIGGGSIPKPGAVSLAHNGILFLDELPEFSRPVLESLREPLENKKVEVSRVKQQVSFPANFQLIAALNPTPSGYFPDDPKGRCKDTPNQIAQYLNKISGPLLDRIDCHLEVPAVEITALQQGVETGAETSEQVRLRVERCQQRQIARQGCLNAQLSHKQLQALDVQDDAAALMQKAVNDLGLSARAYYRILKLALTLADMEGTEWSLAHFAEALSYRPLSRFLNLK